MIANIVGGAMTFGVHFLNKRIPDAEYSIFGMLLMVTAVYLGLAVACTWLGIGSIKTRRWILSSSPLAEQRQRTARSGSTSR